MASITPQLIKQTALAKATQLESRVNALVASSTTELSPVVVYLEGAETELSVNGSTMAAGTWTCPEGIDSLQVECWGAGGGGGGGTATNGGGGGGGGEYACEPSYAVIPGNIYTYAVGRPGQGGVSAGSGGWAGGRTVFDTSANGVTASGGLGGDSYTTLNGGTGSAASIHFNGGNGGVSSAGISSDNPYGQVSNLSLWWLFKSGNSSNGTLTAVYDDSLNSRTGSVVNSEPGPPVTSAVTAASGAAPLQAPVPSPGYAAYFEQDLATHAPSYVTGPAVPIGKGESGSFNGSKLTVSCWVKPDVAKGTWGGGPGFGHQYTTLLANCAWINGIHSNYADTGTSGFALALQNGQPLFYLNDSSTSGAHGLLSSSSLAVTNTWHYLVGTWDGTTMKLYVDGSLASSATPSMTQFGQGSNVIAGADPHTLAYAFFTGYMSNAYIAASAASSSYVSTAYGASPATGGSGGGASGGSGGAGSNGTSATSSTGAAAGAAAAGTGTQLGSGAGGAGGNAGANGSSAPVSTPFGGGGGGAGMPGSTGTVSTVSVPALQSAAYCGFDAQGGNAGALYAVSSQPQAGIVNPYPSASLISSNMYAGGTPSSPFNGSMNSLALFPNLSAQLAGMTVNSATLTFTVQSTSASVLPVWAMLANGGVSQLPATFGSAADITSFTGGLNAPVLLLMIPVPEGAAGRQVTFDITNTTLASWAVASAGRVTALVFGGFQGEPTYDIGDGSYSAADSFAWNSVISGPGSSASDITIDYEVYPSASGNKTGGDGAPGSLVLSYIDPRYWPVTAIQPAAATDSDGNTFAEGITTDSIVGFDQTVTTPPRIPETWHSLGALGTGSNLTVDVARYRYSPEDGGTLVLQVSGHASADLAAGNYVFANTLPSALQPSVGSGGNDLFSLLVYAFNGAVVGVITINGKNDSGAGQVQLQVINSIDTRHIFVCTRIPLT